MFNTYFLRGNNKDYQLNYQSQKFFVQEIEKNPLSTSFLFYNSTYVQEKINAWKEKLSFITPYYAIKSNPMKPLLLDIQKNGINFDCASKREIETVLEIGVKPSQIIASNPVKTEDDIEFCQKIGVPLTTADTIEELEKIKQYGPDLKILWRISIKEKDCQILSTPFSKKFGDSVESIEEIQKRFKELKDLGYNIYGIHFHSGSGFNGSNNFENAIKIADACMKEGKKLGHEMKILDIGGGFPASELNNLILDSLKLLKEQTDYQVIAEPGRHFSAYCSQLATRILATRIKNNKKCYHINDSLYHSFNCILMDGVSFENDEQQFYSRMNSKLYQYEFIDQQLPYFEPSSLFGMTCDGLDIICQNITMPNNLKLNDWIIFGGMGAYTVGPQTQFNGMSAITKVVSWESSKYQHLQKTSVDIIKKETFRKASTKQEIFK